MDNLEKSYSVAYSDEPLGNIEVKITSWPRTRYEAAIFLAGTGKRILDVGCGNGTVLYNLRNSFDELYGLELSKARVITAQRTLKGLNAIIIEANIEKNLPFADEYFDAILCSDVIEHLVDVFAGFSEMTRVLKKGGKLVLTTSNVAELRRRIKFLFGRFPSTGGSNEGFSNTKNRELFDSGHLHYFTFSMLRKLYRRYNYSVIRAYGFGRFGRLQSIFPAFLSKSCLTIGIK